jgi:ligand-binding sensor domain-containing protein
LHGSGDILAGATSGGVVLWDTSGGRTQLVTTSDGLPSHITLDLQLASNLDQVCVATDNGLGRGWFEGTWQSTGARGDEEGASFFACLANPTGGWIAGGNRGALIAWRQARSDSLHVPTRTGRVVGLDVACRYFDTPERLRHPPAQVASAPMFPMGLVVGLDNDGVWLLRDAGAVPRWLRFGEAEGLPSRYVRDVGVDGRDFVWVATRSGLARIGPGMRVTGFENDSLLSQRVETLLVGADGRVYLGIRDGVVRVDANQERLYGARVLTTASPVVALAWMSDGLWWSDGAQVQSLAGAGLDLPLRLASNHSNAIASFADTVWVGHPWGRLSRFDGTTWTRHGPESGLPSADIRSFLRVGATLFVGTSAGLYVQQPGLATHDDILRFTRVEAAPTHVATQVHWQGAHWVGGAEGLWRLEAGIWESVTLWAGADEIVSLATAMDTLWATAGRGGIAYSDGSGWRRPPVMAQLADAYWGRASVCATNGLAVATDRGVALWDSGILRPESNTPEEFFADVGWWEQRLACASARGLWVRAPDGGWTEFGVDDGLPGARVRCVVGDGNRLWVGSTRGVARLLPSDLLADTQDVMRGGSEAEANGAVGAGSVGGALRTHIAHGAQVVLEEGHGSAWAHAGSVSLYDVRGRHVRTLLRGTSGRFVWDTRDAAGRPVASGLFLVRPAPAKRVESVPSGAARILLLR